MAKPETPDPSTRAKRGTNSFFRAARIVLIRLRFLAVFAAVFLVIGGWETIRGYWALWTVGVSDESATSSDTEFFCPMDPGVLSDWPAKCPICNMTLVRRKKGDATPLPNGVVARMQFSPYRLWLGGIKVATVEYAPLSRIVEVPGLVLPDRGVESRRIAAEVFASELDWIKVGDDVEVARFDDRATAPLKGKVREVPSRPTEPSASVPVMVELVGSTESLKPGDRLRVKVRCPVETLELFKGLPSVPPPLVANEPRRVYVCMDHIDIIREAPGRCPRDQSELMARSLRSNQRVRWWCPMHPNVTADRPGQKCAECGGMVLVPRVVSFRLTGTVLSVPALAVIDDGSKTLDYLERGAGMFDGTVVTVGPRCGDSFPVIAGLEPGDRVAEQGAFLIDAENRLNPSLAASYFGAGDRARAPEKSTTEPEPGAGSEGEWLPGLPAADRPLAVRQKICPVTGKPLGSMGVPPKVVVQGRKVFLCCEGCSAALEANPKKYLAKLPDERKD